MKAVGCDTEAKKLSFWISQIVVIVATVAGVYLAASQGLEQAIRFEELTSEENNYFLRKSLRNELADNVVYIREYADKVKAQVVNPELALETFVWKSMTYSPAALETPSELLREAQRFNHAAADIMANKNFQPRNRAENLTKLADHIESNVLPKFDENIAKLHGMLTGRGISLE